jgi:hypothetical protein
MAERTALAILDGFSNKDKHRVPLKPILTIFGTRLHLIGPGLQASEIYVAYKGNARIIKQKGRTTPIRYEFITSQRNVYVDVNASAIKMGVGFGDQLLQTPDFYWVTDRVESILQRFAPLIGC